jgi:hypothetical protein
MTRQCDNVSEIEEKIEWENLCCSQGDWHSILTVSHVVMLNVLKIHSRTGHEGWGGVEVYLYSFYNLGTRWGVGGQRHASATYPRERPHTQCIGSWLGLEPVWTGAEHPPPSGIRSPDPQAHSESLYRLSYRSSWMYKQLWCFLETRLHSCDNIETYDKRPKHWNRILRHRNVTCIWRDSNLERQMAPWLCR